MGSEPATGSPDADDELGFDSEPDAGIPRRELSPGRLKRRNKVRRRKAQRLFSFDRSHGTRYVAGADEAGRGSLAGPLVAAAVLLDLDGIALSDRRALGELDDSKKRTEEEREALYPAVLRAATKVAVVIRCAHGIDSRGLHVTNLTALGTAIERVAVPGATCLTDGFPVPSCTVAHKPVVGGDSTSAAIAAAAIVAKVTRDRCMKRAHDRYPGFDFAGNVGYSTPGHRAAVMAQGPSPIHRRSFASIAYSQLTL